MGEVDILSHFATFFTLNTNEELVNASISKECKKENLITL